jgi:hypothetical protein
MKRNVGEIVIKYLSNKTETRNIIKCDDFFNLIGMMGFRDESQEVIDIIDYLEDNKTDINFHGAKTNDYYNRFRNIEKKVQLSKMLKGSKTEVQKLIEKVGNIKIEERPDWLDYYRNDDDDDVPPPPISERDKNLGQSIIDRLTGKIKDRLDNEPGMTLEEIQSMVDVEMGLSDEQMEQLRNAPDITEEQINEIRNNN